MNRNQTQYDVNIQSKMFNKVYRPYLKDETRNQIFFGGSSSGKSVFIAQRCILDLMSGGRNYLVVRKTHTAIRMSVLNELKNVISEWGLDDLFSIVLNPAVITCKSGYQILFSGLDDVEKIKGIKPIKGVITDIWIEEATESSQDDYIKLSKRLRGLAHGKKKRITMSFNPILRSHWIYRRFFSNNFGDDDKTFNSDQTSILKTTYKNNRFLEPDDVYDLENETDRYYREVYTLGNWGVLGNVIFKNWKTEDLSDRLNLLGVYRNGLDFGFTNDPSALVRCAVREKKIYITGSLYEYGLTNDILAAKTLNVSPQASIEDSSEEIMCDAAEPKSIAELRAHGVNAYSAQKGPGSVNFGIQFLQQYEIIIHHTLQPIINEFQLYQWKENKDGEVMNIPIDKDNHAIDALRYGCSGLMFEAEPTRAVSARQLGI